MSYKPFDLTGKVALVTGGNGGIGLGMAEALAQAGADVVVWGTNPAKNAAAAETLKATGVRVKTAIVNVADEAAVQAAMAEAVEQMGRLDTVIANAAVGGDIEHFTNVATDNYRDVMAVNLDGVFFTLREACKHMIARHQAGDRAGGSLLSISSLAAVEGAARSTPYSAAKGALLALSRSIAVGHARYGIRSNVVLPGWIDTEMSAADVADDNFNAKVITRVPARRWGKPADFGGMAVYLASDASAFHTADQFLIDGGYAAF